MNMMDQFFAGMSTDDKQKIMSEMMPKMMSVMMMNMCGEAEGKNSGKEMDTKAMPQMMMEMMPRCLSMVLPGMPKEERIYFVMKMVSILMEQGSVGLSEKEKKDFLEKVVDKLRT